MTITLKQARKQLPFTMQIKTTIYGEYRVNYRGGKEATAYYTNDLQDAYDSAMRMHEERELSFTPDADDKFNMERYDQAMQYLTRGNAHELLRDALREARKALTVAGKVDEANCMSLLLAQKGNVEPDYRYDYMTAEFLVWVIG